MKRQKNNRLFLGNNPPDSARSAVWSVDQTALDLDKHQSYVIHQLLMFADLDATAWLFQVYGKELVKQTFAQQPERIYSLKSYLFNARYILGLDPNILDQSAYVVNS